MTQMLASVNRLEEALLMHTLGAAIIDMKQPAQGALGALTVEEVTHIVQALPEDCVSSATIGDMAMYPDQVIGAVLTMAKSGVHYIKIGIFNDGDPQATIKALGQYSQRLSLIAVLFADQQPDMGLLPLLAEVGFRGVMLDTQDKQHGSLTEVMSLDTITTFVNAARQLHLLCGLAGSLRQHHIAELLPLQADYLGFRGGLCDNDNRTSRLDIDKCRAIYAALSSQTIAIA